MERNLTKFKDLDLNSHLTDCDHKANSSSWHSEIDPSGQRKRYLKLLRSEEIAEST